MTLCQANLLEAEFQLKGSDAYAARFGQTIADLGDLDDDGYPGKSTVSQSTATFLILVAHFEALTAQSVKQLSAAIEKHIKFL